MQPTLHEKRQQWLDVLSGTDPHAIIRQLAQMTWDAAAYRVINEARRLASPVDSSDPSRGVQLNGLMHELLDRGFFVNQITAIRRLSDTYPLEGQRGVYSFTGLLEDMSAHCHLLTRRSIFDAEKVEYDRAVIERKREKFYDQKRREGENTHFIPHDCSPTLHDLRHGHIDFLTGVEPSNRQPSDQVPRMPFENLKEKVSKPCEEVIDQMNKFIAHAATPQSRANVKAEEAGITLNHLWQTQQQMCEVVGFLSIYVLGGPQQSFLAIPQYDQFLHIERALIDHSNLQALRRVWGDFSRECDRWGDWGSDEYTREFGRLR
jgi:hypothetical protein